MGQCQCKNPMPGRHNANDTVRIPPPAEQQRSHYPARKRAGLDKLAQVAAFSWQPAQMAAAKSGLGLAASDQPGLKERRLCVGWALVLLVARASRHPAAPAPGRSRGGVQSTVPHSRLAELLRITASDSHQPLRFGHREPLEEQAVKFQLASARLRLHDARGRGSGHLHPVSSPSENVSVPGIKQKRNTRHMQMQAAGGSSAPDVAVL